MLAMSVPSPSHSATWPRRRWLAFLCCVVAALAWDASGLDRVVMDALASPAGFPWRHEWWLERVLHDAARQLATLAFVALLAMVWLPWGRWRQLGRWQRLEVVTGTGLALAAVNAVKRNSLTSCPWDLQAFGGTARYVSHWSWGVSDGGPGHCFPGGHASAAMAFLAVALPWLASDRPEQRRWGIQVLVAVLAIGLLLGLTQTLRGAHYPSHTAWTLLICWAVAWLNHRLFASMTPLNLRARWFRRA